MSFTPSIALFLAMVAMAAIPGPGVLAVAARSVGGGLTHSLLAAASVVVGDYIFITLALYGLVTLSNVMGELFVWVRYIGGTCLVWLGISLIRSSPKRSRDKKSVAPKHTTSFVSGLITTLGNLKAIIFYISFFPAFINLSTVTFADTLILFFITTMAVGGVMTAYARVACKASSRYATRGGSGVVKYGPGSMLIGSGIYVASRT